MAEEVTPLPRWRDIAPAGLLVPTAPPVFDRDDLVWLRTPGPPLVVDGRAVYTPSAGQWSLNLYGVPPANVPWYGLDPNRLYSFDTGERWPQTFFFGIKSGRDQGYVYQYEYQPSTGEFLPVGASGLIGGRNSLFDTNAFNRQSNKMLAIIVVTIATLGYAAYALAPAAAAGAGGAAAAGEGAAVGGAATAAGEAGASIAAADIAGGLVPAYGSTAAYEAAITAGASIPAAEGAATATMWDKLIDAAIGQGTKFASSALVSTISKRTAPGASPASANQVAGEYRLPDGSVARVNPDGSITVLDSSGGAARVIGAGGAVSTQWIAGVPNATIFLAGVAVAAALLRARGRA